MELLHGVDMKLRYIEPWKLLRSLQASSNLRSHLLYWLHLALERLPRYKQLLQNRGAASSIRSEASRGAASRMTSAAPRTEASSARSAASSIRNAAASARAALTTSSHFDSVRTPSAESGLHAWGL